MSTGLDLGLTELIKLGSCAFVIVFGIVSALRSKDKATKKRKVLLVIPGVYFAVNVLNVAELVYRRGIELGIRRVLMQYDGGMLCMMFASVLCLLVLFFMKGSATPNTKPETVAVDKTEKNITPIVENIPEPKEKVKKPEKKPEKVDAPAKKEQPAVKDTQALVKVREIAELHKIGALTDEEFEEKKKELLAKM